MYAIRDGFSFITLRLVLTLFETAAAAVLCTVYCGCTYDVTTTMFPGVAAGFFPYIFFCSFVRFRSF